jgi:hypothetical protein
MLFKSLSIVFLILFFSGLARAGDEDSINKALSNNAYVHLQSGTYLLDSPVIINSNNILTGEPGTILQVRKTDSNWFTGSNAAVCSNGAVDNVLIKDISVDGNCINLNNSFANSPGHQHDLGVGIRLDGYSNRFCNNITIENVRVYNTFSDGINVRFANNVQISRVIGSNCQHCTLFLVNDIDSIVHDCELAGITNACLRYDNCVHFLFYNNLMTYYDGDSNGAYKNGNYGVEIGDSDVSHGFDGRNKPNTITDGEGYNNTIVGLRLQAFELDSIVFQEWRNIYLHDNHVYGIGDAVTKGIKVDISNISVSNPPTIEQSQEIFSSIFDILTQEFNFQYLDTQTAINASVNIVYYNNSYNPHSLIYVDGEGLTGIKYDYTGLSTNHYLLISGEKTDIWKGDLPVTGNAVYLNGSFDAAKLQVTCYNSQGYHSFSDFNITEVPDDSEKIVFNPQLWAFVGTLTILGFSIYRNFKRIVIKW